MGIIVRQGFKSSIVSYVGVVIGIFNILILYNQFLTQEQLGLYASTLLTFPVIYMSFALLGVPSVAVRFHSRFQDHESRRQLFTFIIITPLVGLAAFVALYLLFKPLYLKFYLDHSPMLVKYYYVFIPLTVGMVYLLALESYSRINLRIAVPSLIREVGLRLFNSAVVIMFGYKLITFDTMVNLTVVSYGLAIVAMLIYLHFQKRLYTSLDFGFIKHPAFKEMYRYGLWVLLGGASAALLPHIEKVLLPAFEGGLGSTAIFDIASRIALVISIPRNSIVMISAPIISEAYARNDIAHIDTIYKKSSLNLFIIGSFLFLGIWTNIDAIFGIIPKSEIYSQGKWVVLMVGISRIADMMTGLNSEILTNSKYYRYDIVFMLFFTVLILFSSQFLIPLYGFNGAAAAALFSTVIYNFVKLFFIRQKLGIQPFTLGTFKVILLGTTAYLVARYMPFPEPDNLISTVLIILARSVIITVIFGGGILLWNVSEDISAGFSSGWKLIKTSILRIK
ncbi:lipopolysaccharide biosynthesis protein [Dyadobacter fanqingshengii]|uniref:Polysaccharide biosynthesis C-terminal domain-containing protein n=1 Tax=Dyadobacter fanqingshengii TaxID=2906443 RepID=A0A9X1P5U1_9BACT|nr:polysaccharide biosynthesis C-terminal domain-containing protein [Dyadobacter fanqingshengii]MCF0039286.1 polysaccharide biosynthesis C-terminal domain-containing protein [Dyadobacter fanqingshengii]MCF2503172.1 polysaccharide biosynthesis C-terminal domain-containing protein [Dyadobacter fanqingshengii]USJ33897.1 polysaccharide biosynthesis C-terminal domain-containing protein [Dyadobacter fanqingshengii]